MKAIISHDIDHLRVSEHLFKDFIIPKQIIRTHLEFLLGKITINEYLLRWNEIFSGRMENIQELFEFDSANGIIPCFFVSMRKGLGLNYEVNSVIPFLNYLVTYGSEIGLHGMAYDNYNFLCEEKRKICEFLNVAVVGNRFHYLRNTKFTFSYLNECGFAFDSSVRKDCNPYVIGNVIEFPVHIMDGWIIENGKRMQSRNFIQCCDITRTRLDELQELDLRYITIDFHDRYFCRAFNTWKEWYVWLIYELKSRGIEFSSFNAAVSEIKKETWTMNPVV